MVQTSIPPGFISREEEYFSCRENTGFFPFPVTVLALAGADAADLLQRITTNDIVAKKDTNDASPHLVTQTVFVTEKAKIVDAVWVLRLSEKILLIADIQSQVRLREWLNRFIIMEDVAVQDITNEFDHGFLIGKESVQLVQDRFQSPGPVGALFRTPADAASADYVFRDLRWSVPCFSVLTTKPSAVSASGIVEGVAVISEETFERLRIENGIPRYGKELLETINPLEAGLTGAVSFTKGCYIGQEVIARLDTYKKLQKSLKGLIFDSEQVVGVPGKIVDGELEAGYVTSTCYSYLLKRAIGLGYVKTSVTAEKLEYISAVDNAKYGATVRPLPFIEESA